MVKQRIIKFADVFERVFESNERSKYKKDKFYFDTLDALLDELFEEAYNRGLTWSQLANGSGLGYQTVVNLGERWTKRPQLRTVMLIADALDLKFAVDKVVRTEPKIKLAVMTA